MWGNLPKLEEIIIRVITTETPQISGATDAQVVPYVGVELIAWGGGKLRADEQIET